MASEGSNAAPRSTSEHWPLLEMLDQLPLPASARWPHGVFDVEVLRQGGIRLSVFAPMVADFQTPHAQDEIYIVVSGHGELHLHDNVYFAEKGDALFVAAGTPHRFQRFSEDFATWIVSMPRADQPS